MAFFSARSTRLLSMGTPATRKKRVSFSQCLSRYEIAWPRPESGSTFVSSNWAFDPSSMDSTLAALSPPPLRKSLQGLLDPLATEWQPQTSAEWTMLRDVAFTLHQKAHFEALEAEYAPRFVYPAICPGPAHHLPASGCPRPQLS